jgi:hypothetical protein
MRNKTLTLASIFCGLLLWGCYPHGPSYTEELDIVVTHHNPSYDFKPKNTYAMPDRIVKITGNLQQGDAPVFIPDATAAQIITRIASNMESLGWTRVALTANPDLLLTPASWETTTIVYWYDYWYWWYGGYYPYYPGYYPPSYSGYTYTTGTLLMNLMDPSQLGANGNPIAQWTGVINGVMNSVYNASRVNPLIDKAFDQSPYLSTK